MIKMSYIENETRIRKEIKKVLPKNWSVSISGLQFALYDLGYEIDEKKKNVDINYYYGAMRQGMVWHWLPKLCKEIKEKI